MKRLRELELLPEAGHLKDTPPRSYPPPKAPKEGEEPVPDTFGLGFGGVRLSAEQEDEIWLDLTEFLLSESLSGLSTRALSYVTDKEQARALNLLADSHMQRKNFGEATNCLETIISNSPTDLRANTLLGHALYLSSELDKSQEQYLKTIRLANLSGTTFDDKIAL